MVTEKVQYALGDLSMDVFTLTDRGLTVESLTAGHGMAENEASSSSHCSGSCSCGGGSCSCGDGGWDGGWGWGGGHGGGHGHW
ncbi:thiomuracin/GE37468 family thiazolyl RiPP peptide [Kutzneria buriramensis]|uniref:Uncharacterized protein n=1 Tax=Kutzneria buriramensis TaxID=1045776 RepID=A0A3E0H4N4_9PSEU|nr:thiomuracin/GE37468 family thiazolyl RiPP peptide [Kutzneria buriramensis]REH38061.1 hypothetical protein BCF44_11486 [Kutzneria buriramensis]